MGLKDGTYWWLAGIVEAIDVWACSDGTVHKQYKYKVKLDDRTIGCVYAPEDTAYFIRAEGGTPASPDLPPPTPPSAFGSFRFGVGDSVACLMWTDERKETMPICFAQLIHLFRLKKLEKLRSTEYSAG
jgi:hypothetical protein